MKKLVLIRTKEFKDRFLGTLLVFDGIMEQAKFSTLELPWRENTRETSCIPEGRYTVSPRSNAKFGDHLIVNKVEGRDWILFHSGNIPDHTKGCILVGLTHGDMDGDGIPDVLSSRAAMGLLSQLVPETAVLVIVN